MEHTLKVDMPIMIKRVVKSFCTLLNSPFPYYLNDEKKNFLMVLISGVSVTAFLYLFKTTTNPDFARGPEWLHGLLTLVTLLFNILALPKIFPTAMDPVNWTIQKYLLHCLLHLLIIWVLITATGKAFFCTSIPLEVVAGQTLMQVSLNSIIPIVIISLFLRSISLNEHLKEAILANQKLEKIQARKKEPIPLPNSITLYSNTSESLTFNLRDLLFIEADDNYSNVVWKEGESIHKKLLRVNLKKLELQLDNSFTLRCHRSYIINVNAISTISGNANGYRLKVNGLDFSIPVSRTKGKEVINKIGELKNVMELS